jgi:RNA polymerase sigma-70 factor (ECF subfamily)
VHGVGAGLDDTSTVAAPRPLQATDAYRNLAPHVLGYLRAQRVPDPEDVLGEVFLQVARDFHRFQGDEGDLRRWVFSIAHNRAVDAHRRRGRDRSAPHAAPSEAADARPAVEPAPPDPFDPEMAAALATLTDDQREILVLRFVGDLPLAAVAKITGRATGAVKALQHRALENLRKAISPDA